MKFDAQIAANGVSGSIYFKNFPEGMPPDPPSRSHAFGARLHDHSHDASFATVYYMNIPTPPLEISFLL